jgi:hypothetical protein
MRSSKSIWDNLSPGAMSTAIFNREGFKHPADGWYELEHFGEHLNVLAGVILSITPEAGASIGEKFNAAAAAGKLPQGHEMLIDHEHFKDDAGKESIAYGWLQELQLRADGIYGRIRWTAVGQAAVDGGEYRFFSTEYAPEDVVDLGGDPPRVRPMRLAGLTLTNMPNNKGGKPITNRAGALPIRLPKARNPGASQVTAAQIIALLADEEQRTSGASLSQSWLRVMNREKQLTSLASGRLLPGDLTGKERESREAPAEFAGRLLLQLAQERGRPSLSANLTYIRNRFPGLARMANREAGWDALAELEPAAHAAYMALARGDSPPIKRLLDDARGSMKAQFPNLRREEIWAKVTELYPRQVAQFRVEQTASDPRFQKVMQSVMVEFPDLGFEGRWQKIQEIYPKLFWGWVMSFSDAPEK